MCSVAVTLRVHHQEFRLKDGKITGGTDPRLRESLQLVCNMMRIEGYVPDLDLALADVLVRDMDAEIIHADRPAWMSNPPDTVY